MAAPGTYTLPSGLSITYGQPVPYESEYAYIYEKNFGETPLFFKVPVSVTNDSATLVDGNFFTHVVDVEAGKRCDLSMFDSEGIVRIQPGATAEGAMTVTCPASTVGKPFTIGAYFNPDGVGSMEGNHFKYTLTGTVPG